MTMTLAAACSVCEVLASSSQNSVDAGQCEAGFVRTLLRGHALTTALS